MIITDHKHLTEFINELEQQFSNRNVTNDFLCTLDMASCYGKALGMLKVINDELKTIEKNNLLNI